MYLIWLVVFHIFHLKNVQPPNWVHLQGENWETYWRHHHIERELPGVPVERFRSFGGVNFPETDSENRPLASPQKGKEMSSSNDSIFKGRTGFLVSGRVIHDQQKIKGPGNSAIVTFLGWWVHVTLFNGEIVTSNDWKWKGHDLNHLWGGNLYSIIPTIGPIGGRKPASTDDLFLKPTNFWRFPAKAFRQKNKTPIFPGILKFLKVGGKKTTIKFANLFGRRKSTSREDEQLRLSLAEAVAPNEGIWDYYGTLGGPSWRSVIHHPLNNIFHSRSKNLMFCRRKKNTCSFCHPYNWGYWGR